MLLSLTVSFAKSQSVSADTVRCYGMTELREIAISLEELDACDTILSTTKIMLANRDSMIVLKDSEISKQSLSLMLKDKIIGIKENEIERLTEDLNKANTHKKLLTIGWGSTSLVFVGMIFYLAIH
jgi:hypothetical protein